MDADKLIEQLFGHTTLFEKSEEDGIPVYFQLAKWIQQQIEKGSLSAGALIPSERKIASHTNLSLATVRKALEMLVHRGFLTRIQGKGTYVAGTNQRFRNIRYYPLVHDFYDDVPSAIVKPIDLEMVNGSTLINRYLKIGETKKLYKLRRILTYNGTPMVFCISYLPCELFSDFEKYESVLTDYLYMFLEDKYGVTTISHWELFSASLANEEIANQLKIEIGHPVLKVEKLILTHKEKPYEYRTSYCLTDERKILSIRGDGQFKKGPID